ncbi:50S ribosomal protein L23 [Chlamydia suis]|uniref:50S ribosomal protein L23 n=1 Tax=Chlamydia suis TaxID=83559 RepID=UPI0009B0C093|nr:50S ribosomal protein L23 [Chlamydia suis]QYC71824.1 50S ribosomal protein L23 [Chlamydia suis]QYC72721.1 50S ribosomal protein L23 [Chlamydia suis]QYC73618.1 50S ribosomal protein L23 [Chlamydia suis]QYC79056.1 50S ribosomal protein L23 [Chlamydia suis]QYC80021.1 50S ribosomal protein L23 [Chlamydia suis]
MKDPYDVVKRHYVTEKAKMLEGLSLGGGEGKKKGSYCKDPKYTFVVAGNATKPMIAEAIEAIYANKGVKVKKVNTVCVKPQPTRISRGRKRGRTAGFKKAIVTFIDGHSIG